MILKKEYSEYIAGTKFDKGYRYKITGRNKLGRDKIVYLSALLKGKSVIHLGCTDHVDCIDQKIKENIWLHKIITNISKDCIGIDINEEAINYIKNKYANQDYAKNIYMADITSNFLKEHHFRAEYLLMGEILEHIDNPVDFLKQIVEKNRDCIDKIIITVPNMYNIHTKIFSWFNIEQINTDHRYWFSPITLWKVASQAGLKVLSIDLVSSPISKKLNLTNVLKVISRYFFEWKPLNRKHIVLVAAIDKQGKKR